MRAQYRFLLLCLAVAVAIPLTPEPAAQAAKTARPHATPRFRTPRMRFEPNLGQTDASVRFTARSREGAIFLTDGEALLRVRGGRDIVRVAPVGATFEAKPEGVDRLEGESNYFRGSNPERWRSGVPGFARVRYSNVYPGVDLVYYGADGALEYDFVLEPGADPGQIRLRVDGARSVAIDPAGDLVMKTSEGEIRHHAPRTYQPAPEGRRPVPSRYTMTPEGEVGFEIGAYDAALPLVVDPEVAFATYLGGGDFDDGRDIAVGPDGAVYVTGTTTSTDFPTAGALQNNPGDVLTSDVFVAKLSADGGTLLYATYLGGNDADNASAIAVDDTGAIYVAGTTQSTNFPRRNAIQSIRKGDSDGFVAKIAPDGRSLVFSTYYGGSADEQCSDVVVLPDHQVAIGGRTTSEDLTVKDAVQDTFGGGISDGFVAVLNEAGSQFVTSTYVGGDSTDQIDSVIAGPGGAVYASGATDSTDLAPCTNGAPDDGLHAFVAIALGGSGQQPYAFPCEEGSSIAAGVAAGGPSSGFAIHALFGAPSNLLDVRAVTINPSLGFVRQKIFGGSGQDYPDAVAVGPFGTTVIAGDTDSEDLPLVEPTQATFGGLVDAFVVVLAPGSDDVMFATYLGGNDVEFPSAVATDADGNVYVTGVTFSEDFPTSDGALQSGLRGATDAFVVKLTGFAAPADGYSISLDQPALTVHRKDKGTITVNIGRSGGFDGEVTVTAPFTKPIKVKLTPVSQSTAGDALTFNYKIKKKAAAGTYTLEFSARDGENRERTATLQLTIEE